MRLKRPIAFEAVDKELVDVVCLIVVPPGRHTEYLNLLSRIARRLRSPAALATIRSAAEAKVYFAIAECHGS